MGSRRPKLKNRHSGSASARSLVCFVISRNAAASLAFTVIVTLRMNCRGAISLGVGVVDVDVDVDMIAVLVLYSVLPTFFGLYTWFYSGRYDFVTQHCNVRFVRMAHCSCSLSRNACMVLL